MTFSFDRLGGNADALRWQHRSRFGNLIPQASLRWSNGAHNWMTYITGGLPGTTFLLSLPPPGPAKSLIIILAASAAVRPRPGPGLLDIRANCRENGFYLPVAFNDIKHLARSMPADGLEAQDVVPPRCGCWVARIAIFSSRRWFLGKAHTLARALSRCSACNHLEIAAGEGHDWPLERCC